MIDYYHCCIEVTIMFGFEYLNCIDFDKIKKPEISFMVFNYLHYFEN